MTRISVRALTMCALLAFAAQALAQSYPARAIDLIIPLAAGDATDIAGRTIGDALARELKVPLVPQNKPGAGGGLGTDLLAKAAKDGYTIGLPNNAALVFRAVTDPAGTNYDSFKDLEPLAMAMRSPSILAVGAQVPFASAPRAPARSATSACRPSTRSPAPASPWCRSRARRRRSRRCAAGTSRA
jgi:tripartite-type tricarboxylate transporter receptor subunit TctC